MIQRPSSSLRRVVRLLRLRLLLWTLAVVAGAALALGARCSQRPSVRITSPASGLFTTAAGITVTGEVKNVGAELVDVTVNGVSVLPLSGSGTFSIALVLDPLAVFNPIVAEVTRTNGKPLRARVTVVAGDSVVDGDYSPMGVALRLNDSGLDQAEPLITSLVDFDPATLLKVGTLVIDNFCAIDSIFGCLGRVDVKVASPAPAITGFGITTDALGNDSIAGDISVSGLVAYFDIISVSGIAPSCGLRVAASSTQIDGNFGLQPDAIDPSLVDVFQNGLADVNFTGFSQDFTYGLCDFPLIGDLIQLIVGSLEGDVETGFENFLNTVDAAGNTPVAGAIETALSGIEISGPIGQAIGVNLETPLFDVYEDPDGLTLDSDARITASLPLPEAPDLPASYHVDQAFPPFGPLTPVGGVPYDLAIAISTSAFNQLLKAEVESGLLRASVTEFDLGTGPIPLTAGFMATFVPEFSLLDPVTPLRIDLEPTLAPVVTGQTGPNGEQNELRIGHMRVKVVVDEPPGQLLLDFAVDLTVGLDIGFDAGTGLLAFTLSPTINPVNINVTILQNTLASSEPQLTTLVQQLGALLFPELATSLESFPLPDFLGLQLGFVESSKNGEFDTVFFDLVPSP